MTALLKTMPYVLTTISEAGGVGKTTISLNVAHALFLQGYRPLVIDLDPNGSMKTFVGFDNAPESSESSAMLFNHSPSLHTLPAWEGAIDVSLAPMNMRDVLESLSGQTGFNYRLADAINATAGNYDFILIDPPGTAGAAQINAVFAADAILVPVELEAKVVTLNNLIQRIAQDFKAARNPKPPVYLGVQPNKYNKGAATHRAFYAAIREQLSGIKVFDPIGDYKEIINACAEGKPLGRHRPGHVAVSCYKALASAVAEARNKKENV